MIDTRFTRHLTSRDLLMMGFMAFSTVGCSLADAESQRMIDANKTPLATVVPKPTATALISPTPTVRPAIRLNEFHYQPNGRPALSSEQMAIAGSNVEILNYSDFAINVQVLREYFTFLGQLPQQLPQIDMVVSGRNLRFNLGLRPNIARRLYFVKPSDPMPEWWTSVPSSVTAITRTLPRGDGLEESVTLVRLFQSAATKIGDTVTFTDVNRENEWGSMTEVCQSILLVTGQPPMDNNLAKEILCNSFGVGATMRSYGGDYRSFLAFARTADLKLLSTPIMLTDRIPEATYSRIPSGKVTK